MSNVAIRAEDISKAYQLGQIGTGTISRDLERWYARIRGKEDPFLRIGEANDRSSKGSSDIVWSLKDINFEIEQGDAIGIIGRNGAGKSTLLKILSKVTAPTTGKITGKGRIASLLEVGTGFHPELSGRENIFLNGAILGMRKKEIQRKLEEIVDFAGIERYLDTPVKRYSSGMYVRLAFAVAAHLESEILIVDEVLAVGDAEFQKKCLGKMGEVSKGEGRTVLFVSHNMGSVSNLCDKLMLLNNGSIQYHGNISEGVALYHDSLQNEFKALFQLPSYSIPSLHTAYISSIKLINDSITDMATDESLVFSLKIIAIKNIINHRIGLRIVSKYGTPVGLSFSKSIITIAAGSTLEINLEVTNHNLAKGTYSLDFSLGTGDEESVIDDLQVLTDVLIFQITRKYRKSTSKILNWNATNWGNTCFKCELIDLKNC